MKRNTNKYTLIDGNEIVYVGTTNDPLRREAEHRRDKDFDKMNVIGRKCTQDSAEQWETERIQTYMKNHGGKTPKYNQNDTG